MSQSAVVPIVLQIAWLAWTPAVAVLVVRALRPAWPTERRALGVLMVAVAVLLAGVFALPFQVDASGVMGMLDASPTTGQWKGTAGRALVGLWTRAGLGHFGVIIAARLYLILAVALAVALLLRSRAGKEAGDSRALLVGALVLLALPSFTFGILAVHRSFFYSPLVLATLLALDELDRSPSVAGATALVAGLALLGFTRPELIVAGGLLGVLVVGSAARHRRRLLAAGVGLVLLLFAWAAPDVLRYLVERMRSEPLLMGSDVAVAAPMGQVALVGLKRIAVHVPLNAVCLLVSLQVVVVLAAIRLRRLVRTRTASWAELAAALLLVTELIAIGIHREGFSRVAKYGQLVTVPAWYLALHGLWLELDVSRRRVWQRRLVVATVTFLMLNVGLTLSGVESDGLRPSRSWRSRQDDFALLWRTVPSVGRRICRPAGAARASILVVGLDERAEGSWPLGRYLGIEPGKWESERWPIVHQLRRDGCAVHAVYPSSPATARELLSQGLLEGPVLVEGGTPRSPTHVLVTYCDYRRRAELREVAGGAWRIEAEVGGATLLARGAAPRPSE